MGRKFHLYASFGVFVYSMTHFVHPSVMSCEYRMREENEKIVIFNFNSLLPALTSWSSWWTRHSLKRKIKLYLLDTRNFTIFLISSSYWPLPSPRKYLTPFLSLTVRYTRNMTCIKRSVLASGNTIPIKKKSQEWPQRQMLQCNRLNSRWKNKCKK